MHTSLHNPVHICAKNQPTTGVLHIEDKHGNDVTVYLPYAAAQMIEAAWQGYQDVVAEQIGGVA